MNKSHELWLTPPAILYALGDFDLDPCACPDPRPYPTARRHIASPEDGLAYAWQGRVWCNPPYGDKTGIWLERMARHGCGIALVYARTDTEAWHRWVWPFASGVFFIKGRVGFRLPDGTKASHSPAPSVLIAYSKADTDVLAHCILAGRMVRL